MGISSRECGVLKLVHPGRHVETHTVPITAAEILKKYPRHCIARPDVFRFPWIVVRPESVLHPGKVFYLVPHHTLYNLLKSNGKRNQPDSRENQFSRNGDPPPHHHHECLRRHNSQIKCWGGITPKQCKHNQHETRNWRKLQNVLFQDRTNRRDRDRDSEGYQSDTSYVNAWDQISDRLRKPQLTTSYHAPPTFDDDNLDNFHPRRRRNSAAEIVPSTLDIVSHGVGGRSTHQHQHQHHMRNSEARTKLKSCFRKQDSTRKLLNLRVTFGRPILIPLSPPENASLVV